MTKNAVRQRMRRRIAEKKIKKRKRKLDYRGQTQPQTKRRSTIISISLGNPLRGLTYVFHELIRNLRRTVSLFQGEREKFSCKATRLRMSIFLLLTAY